MVLSRVDSECRSLLKINTDQLFRKCIYADPGGFQKGGKCMQLLKFSGWDQKFSDHDNFSYS